MYNDAWDDYYDHREDAREDWQDHREDLDGNAAIARRTDRNSGPSAPARPRSSARSVNRRDRKTDLRRRRNERSGAQGAAAQSATSQAQRPARTGNAEARGYGEGSRSQAATQKNSGSSDAFSGYSNGRSTSSASSRGQQSRSSSRSRGGRRPPPVSDSKEADTHDQTISARSALVFACAWLALLASRRPPRDRPRRTVRLPRLKTPSRRSSRAVKTGNVDALLAVFGPEGRELIASSDSATARMNRQVFAVAFREQWHLEDATADRKTLVVGNEELALPGAARQRRRGMAIRHRRRQGRSAGAADRTKRAAGDRDLPCLRHRAAALRATGTRRQARRPARGEVPERSRQGERPVLAGRARPEAESTW